MLIGNENKTKKRLFEVFQKVNGIVLNESDLSKQEKEDILKDIVIKACNDLGVNEYPKVIISYDPNEAKNNKSFANYNPNNKSLRIVAINRNLADVCRSTVHEIKHYDQDLKGELNNDSGETGSNQENEANAFAGIFMRKYGKLHPEIFE